VSSIKEHIKFDDYEIIAVDNREKEKSPINIENVKIVSAGNNLGMFEGRRFGFKYTQGKFVWNFDVDDLAIGDLYLEDFKDVDFIQTYYLYNPESNRKALLDKHLPSAYGANVWSRYYSRNILEKAYGLLNKPVIVPIFEDRLLFDLVNSFKPTYDYIERPIYQYNYSNVTNPEEIERRTKEMGTDSYDYVYIEVLKKPWWASLLKEKLTNLIRYKKYYGS
jgi:glycosyltransferase involved in cell wall biosynthesis